MYLKNATAFFQIFKARNAFLFSIQRRDRNTTAAAKTRQNKNRDEKHQSVTHAHLSYSNYWFRIPFKKDVLFSKY